MPLVTIWNSSDSIFEMVSSALKALSTIRPATGSAAMPHQPSCSATKQRVSFPSGVIVSRNHGSSFGGHLGLTSKREFITDKWFNSSVPSGSGISTAKGFDVSIIAWVSVWAAQIFVFHCVACAGPWALIINLCEGFFFVHELIHNSFLSDEAG